jgi:hypothetical protein
MSPSAILHHFHEIDLIAVRSLAWIFPDQQTLTVRKRLPCPMPTHQFIGPASRPFLKERTNLAMPAEYTAATAVEDRLDERSFQHCLFGIKRQ